jgi:hypothetical protein
MGFIGLTIDASGYSGYAIAVIYKATSPLVEVDRSPAFPFPVSTVHDFINLSDEVYVVKLFQSSNGVALTTLIRTWDIDAGKGGKISFQEFEYVTDRGNSEVGVWADPVTGDTQINDTRLSGAAQADVSLYTEGKGKRIKSHWEMLPTGGIKLLVAGEFFDNGQAIFVTLVSTSSGVSGVPAASSGTDISDVVNISSNTSFSTAHKNKLINCTSSTAVTVYTLNSLATMPDCKLAFSTHGMTGNYLTIQFGGSDTIKLWGADRNKIHLAKGREITILFRSNVAYILPGSNHGYDTRGQRQLVDAVGLNQLLADGQTEYQIAEWPGIVEWIQSLPAHMIITSYLSWTPTYGIHKFYYNESLGVFRLPDDRGMFYRALNGFTGGTDIERYGPGGLLGGTNSNTPGAYQADEVKQHSHDYQLATGTASGGTLVYGRGGTPLSAKGSTDAYGGSETRGKNVGQLAVMNI